MVSSLLTVEGGRPVDFSFEGGVWHGLITGKTGAGKSLLAGRFIADAMRTALSVAVLDVVKPDGSGSYSDFTYHLGGRYQDMKIGGNPLEPPCYRGTAQDIQDKRLEFEKSVVDLLLAMVLGPRTQDLDLVRSLLQKAVATFYADSTISKRFADSSAEGIGSRQQQEEPTLRDLLVFFNPELFAHYGEEARELCGRIVLKLEGWLARPLGESFCRPRRYEDTAQLVVYPLVSVDDDEAPVIAQRILLEVRRNALRSERSFFFVDEIPVLIRHPAIASTIAAIVSTGRKQMTFVLMASQGPASIEQSPARAQILDNLSVRFIGVTEASAIADYERLFRYPRTLILPTSEPRFYPSKQQMYSNWIIDRGGFLTPARFYPDLMSLSLLANENDEMSARTRMLREYDGDAIKGMIAFSHALKHSFQSGISIAQAVDDWLYTHR